MLILSRLLSRSSIVAKRKMSTFISHVNRITGRVEWDFKDDDYDYKQEIARSAYADMLHDTERNHLYYEALKVAVKKKVSAGSEVHVLDIGTGTGLLSMMAARLGADTVHACEAFAPMAECARHIIADNGFADKIKIIPKRSTELIVGEDMPRRANILVTEVFDTELIGEGAIGTFTHALRELLTEDCIVVPSIGNMYVQLVSSDLVLRWNSIDGIGAADKTGNSSRITSPKSISACGGAPSLHDLQLDQLPMDTFTVLTDPIKVFRFDFTGRTPLPYENTAELEATMQASGQVDAVFMWWDLEMDPDSQILLSCAPRWAHPTPNNMQWRDHWMQAIYYPYNKVKVDKGDEVKVIAKHDEYSLWFDVSKGNKDYICPTDRPICECGAHIAYSRSRLGMLSDPTRQQVYTQMLKKHIKPDSSVACISDGSLLPLLAVQLGARHVYAVEHNFMCARVTREFVKHNNMENRVTVLEKSTEELSNEDLPEKVDLLIGEPVFQTSILPWDNLTFWYMMHTISGSLSPGAVCLPASMTIYAVPVEFEHLWKIRADVGMCEGFNLQQFDRLIQLSSDQVDETVEPQPLWEYPCSASGPVQTLIKVDFSLSPQQTDTTQTTCTLDVKRSEPCNGVAMWVEFDFKDGHVISTGPQQPMRIGNKIIWDYYTRQGVHLFYNCRKCIMYDNDTQNSSVDVSVCFKPIEGDMSFKFKPSWV